MKSVTLKVMVEAVFGDGFSGSVIVEATSDREGTFYYKDYPNTVFWYRMENCELFWGVNEAAD